MSKKKSTKTNETLPPGTLYDGRTRESWEEELGAQQDWLKRHALAAFALLGLPESFLDVGCGVGTAVLAARNLGVNAFGVDQLCTDNQIYYHANLVDKFALPEPVAMVWCSEVAEHLHESAHATLCDTLADNLAEGRGHYLIFTSAYPGQGGIGHLAERPAGYWHDQFSLRHLNFKRDLSVNLALLWSNIGSPLYWLAANVMVFEK